MKAEGESFKLKGDVFFVGGAKRSALYDVNSGNVYSLNEEAGRVIEAENQENIKPGDDLEFWQKLLSMGLASIAQNDELALIPQEIEIPRPNLEFAWLEITERCNEKCIHCYGSFFSQRGNADVSKQPLTFDDWKNIIHSLVKNGCNKIQFIGGEPFIYRDGTKNVLDLAEYALANSVDLIEIFTNGTMVNPQVSRKLKNLGVQVAMSFYSSDAVMHDRITGLSGSHIKTLAAVRSLTESDVPLRVCVVLMKQNTETIEKTLELLEEIGVKNYTVDVVRPSGRTLKQPNGLEPGPEMLMQYGLITKPNFITDRVSFYRNHKYHSCLAGKIAITSSGKIIPCIFARDKIVGDLKKERLEEILQSSKLMDVWELTKDKVLICRSCEYRYACFDCRPLAEGANCGGNDFSSAPYPRCTYNPYAGEWGKGLWKTKGNREIFYENFPPFLIDEEKKGGEIS